MSTGIRWLTRNGVLTTDNRDVHACAERAEASLYLIADGSSSQSRSGELAHTLLARLQQAFLQLPATQLQDAEAATAVLVQLLSTARYELRADFRTESCSYLLLLMLPGCAITIHEGDCCLGIRHNDGRIDWLTAPHCQANWLGSLKHAEIAAHPERHRLTRCFSARRPADPQITRWEPATHHYWLLATDGFWASLSPEQQQTFLLRDSIPPAALDDDISCLLIPNFLETSTP